MIYAGNRPESEAKTYKDRQYTHSTYHHGKEVRWYDCWTHEDEHRPAFREDELQKHKVREIDRLFRNNQEEEDYDTLF